MDVLIIDYSMGNLRSVQNAFAAVGCQAVVSRSPSDLRRADRIVLPGVGAFGDGMRNLEQSGWIDALEAEVRGRAKPFLGLCLGMQVLAERGSEHGDHPGLGWLPGEVERFPANGIRVPHVGWNDVAVARHSRLCSGLEDRASFYFVHSYVLRLRDETPVVGTCDYGGPFPAIVERDNLFATQFHPEKSQRSGLAILRNFAALC